MPINFENLKPYRIDYDSLFSWLNNLKIFDQKNIQELFFKKWKEELIKHDQIIMEQFCTYGKKKILELFSLHNEFENFYIPFLFSESNIEIIINFRISMISRYLEKHPIPDKAIGILNIDEITKSNSDIKFTKIKSIKIKKEFNIKPIYLTEFFNGKYSYLVIDGNHRLSQAIKLNHNTIKAIIIKEETIILLNAFLSSFDKYLYIFINVIDRLVTSKINKSLSDNDLLNLSFLNEHKFKF